MKTRNNQYSDDKTCIKKELNNLYDVTNWRKTTNKQAMKKKLSERIAERAKLKQHSRNAKNRAQFLNVRDEIQEALDEKWTLKDIWETLHIEGAITFSYEAFRKHVNAWQNPSKPPTNEKREAQTTQDDDKKNATTGTKPEKSFELPGFKYNPIPNKEELY